MTSGNSGAAELRGFGPRGLLAILVITLANLFPVIPLSAILVLFWARESQTPWTDLGFVRPRNWALTILLSVLAGAAFMLVLKAVVKPLLGGAPVNTTYHYLVGNWAALPGAVFLMVFRAGFGEETFYRGFLFERWGKRFGETWPAKLGAVLFTSLLFAAGHLSDQGLPGAAQAALTGVVFGTYFALTRKIWPLMIAHAAFDLAAVAVIFLNLETTVAHLIFK